MDLTNLVGKNVLIQFKNEEVWMVLFAPVGEDDEVIPSPEVMMINKGARAQNDPGTPAYFPFVHGLLVDAAPTVEMETGSGGVVHTTFSRDVIHSVSVVKAAAAVKRVEHAGPSPLIQVP